MGSATVQQRARSDSPTRRRALDERPAPPDPLRAFTASTKAWDRHHVRLSRRLTCGLWVVVAGAGAVGGWLATAAPCHGLVCTIASLGHPRVLLVLAGFCVATLLLVALPTRGLTRAGAAQLGSITVAAAAGIASLLGVMAVAVLALLGTVLVLAAFAFVVDRL